MTRTATHIADVSHEFTGRAHLYKVDPPMPTDSIGGTTDHVVVSQTIAMFSGPETYIFPSDEHGNVTSWIELDGSTSGYISHEDALGNAGYRIAENTRNTP